MAWLLAKAADTLKKAQDQLQDAEFIQKLGEVDIVQKAKDAAKEVATAANKVSESVQAEYRRTFEELDCQIFQVRPDLMIMEYPSLQTIERLAKRLNAAHAQKMLIFNLSEEPYESGKFEGEVLDLPLNGLELPPLKDLLQLCLSAQQWLATDQENVVVVHGREGFARAAAFAGCFQAFRGQGTPKEALKELQRQVEVAPLPSQQRYLGYFAQFLEGTASGSARRLRLCKAMLSGVPGFETEGAAFRPFVEVRAGETLYSSFKGQGEEVWPSSYAPTDSVVSFPLPTDLVVSGDVLVEVSHLYLSAKTEKALKLAFHTGFIKEGLQLAKSELDLAAGDSRFGEDFFVDLVFQEVPKNEDSAEEEEKLQQLAEEEAQLFEKARQVSQKLRAEEEQRLAAAAQEAAASSAAAADGDASDGDIEALEATLMGRTPREPSPTPSAGASEASQKEEAQPKQTANGEAGSPDPAPAPKPAPAPAPEKKPVPKAAPKAEPQAAADIDNLFSDFDAVLSGAGASASASAAGSKGGYESKAAAKDTLAEVDDFLKELDGT